MIRKDAGESSSSLINTRYIEAPETKRDIESFKYQSPFATLLKAQPMAAEKFSPTLNKERNITAQRKSLFKFDPKNANTVSI